MARCGWIRCKEGGFMLFRKDIEPRCACYEAALTFTDTQVTLG